MNNVQNEVTDRNPLITLKLLSTLKLGSNNKDHKKYFLVKELIYIHFSIFGPNKKKKTKFV